MSKKAYAIAVVALIGAAPIAFAAQLANAEGQSQRTTQPGQMLATKMIGSRVYDLQNRNIGNVRDLIVNRDGKINTPRLLPEMIEFTDFIWPKLDRFGEDQHRPIYAKGN